MKAAMLAGMSVAPVDVDGEDHIRSLLFHGADVVPQVALVVMDGGDAAMFCPMEGVLTDRPANYYATLFAIEAGRRPMPVHGDAYVVGIGSDGLLTDCPEWVYEWAKEVERQITPPENNDATRN